MIGLLDGLKIGAGVALGIMLATGPVYIYGKRQGQQAAAVAAIENSVKVLRNRSQTDAEISTSRLDGLCAYFGLSDDERGECVRRLAEADSDNGNSRQDRHGR